MTFMTGAFTAINSQNGLLEVLSAGACTGEDVNEAIAQAVSFLAVAIAAPAPDHPFN